MERLGLWGDGTAFKSFDSFLTSITKRGLGKVTKYTLKQWITIFIELSA